MSDTGSGGTWQFDWGSFPALTKVMQANGDANTHLAWLGVDAQALFSGTGGGTGGSGTGWQFDWANFPALTKVMQANGDANTHLAWLGVDTQALSQTA